MPVQRPPIAPPVAQQSTPVAAAVAPSGENTEVTPSGDNATPKKKRGRKARDPNATEGKIDYPGIFQRDEQGNPVMAKNEEGKEYPALVKLSSVPTDYHVKAHNPLRKSDFTKESIYWRWRENEAKKEAELFAKRADRMEKLGVVAENKNASKLLKLQEQLAALRAQLQGEMSAEEFAALEQMQQSEE